MGRELDLKATRGAAVMLAVQLQGENKGKLL